MSELVTKEVCDERKRNTTDRLTKTEMQYDKLADNQRRIETLSIQMGEILKMHTSTIHNHETRLSAVEKRPAQLWDKLVFGLLGAVTSMVVAFIMNRW